uniref:non-specific serine/threonine protein kinase n=1 Tax=Kalanchoe fedtschenkoi TaxID=63787 RepID=A0A7N0U8I8_KALFE
MIGDEAHSAQLSLGNLKAVSVLGRGAKGVVFLVSDDDGKELLALKVISKALIAQSHSNKKKSRRKKTTGGDDDGFEFADGGEYKRIWFERDVLMRLEHPLLPKLRGVVENQKIVGYAMDYCPGRDLNSLRRKQSEKMFSDDIIRFYAAELVLILDYLHKQGIVYRDLKPENVMIQASGHLMLVDFDLSTKLMFKSPGLSSRTSSTSSSSSSSSAISSHRTSTSSSSATTKINVKTKRRSNFYRWCNAGIAPEEQQHHSIERGSVSDRSDASSAVLKSNSFVGTEEYVAPEIIQGDGHEFGVDWWSLGVVLYEMLYGATPFRGSNRKETFYRILSKTPELVGEATPLRDLIRRLLEKDPRKRIGADEIKGHEFFRGVDWESVAEISRPPWIPEPVDECDLKEDVEIDVESFVDEVFAGEVAGNASEGGKMNGEVGGGMWEGGSNHPTSQANDFLVF